MLALFGAVAVVAVGGAFMVWRARIRSTSTDAFQAPVQQMQADQQRVAASLETLTADMAHVRERTDELERILRTVDQ